MISNRLPVMPSLGRLNPMCIGFALFPFVTGTLPVAEPINLGGILVKVPEVYFVIILITATWSRQASVLRFNNHNGTFT